VEVLELGEEEGREGSVELGEELDSFARVDSSVVSGRSGVERFYESISSD
jgi:hypothetical protein